jgi:hypothetical protein
MIVSSSASSVPLAAEIAGWYGTAAILGAFALSSFGALSPRTRSYLLLNLTGALGVAWLCWCKTAWQAFWLEAIWAAIALLALLRRPRP